MVARPTRAAAVAPGRRRRRGVYGFVRLRTASRGRGASRPRLVGRAAIAGAVHAAAIERLARAALRVLRRGSLLGASPRERATPFEEYCQQERREHCPDRRDR